MTWFYLLFVLHLLIGIFCAHLANEMRYRVEPWFLAGTLLGGVALVGLLFANKRSVSQ